MKKAVVLFFLLGSICGCATFHGDLPGKEQWRDAALGALRHPGTWVPVIGAAAVAIGGWDRDISDWARGKTPVFGSQKSAIISCNTFRALSHGGMVASTLAIYNPEKGYWVPMMERMIWEYMGAVAATETRTLISAAVDRDRPNGSSRSFPSGHSTKSFAYVAATYRNMETLELHPFWEYSAKTIETGFGVATAWAKLEAGAHYPTDVLAGAALGNFISLLIHDALLVNDLNATHLSFQIDSEHRLTLTLNLPF